MILPNKYLQENDSLLGVGAILLEHINLINLSDLWDRVKKHSSIGTFERFILGLDLLFILGLISLDGNQIKRLFV